MPRRPLTFLLRPRWMLGHVVVLAAAVTMVLLGRWQWNVSVKHHWPLQNSSYVAQWWVFAAFALVLWGKIVYDAATGKADRRRDARDMQALAEAAAPVAYRRFVLPRNTALPLTEAGRAAYHAHLAGRPVPDELPSAREEENDQ